MAGFLIQKLSSRMARTRSLVGPDAHSARSLVSCSRAVAETVWPATGSSSSVITNHMKPGFADIVGGARNFSSNTAYRMSEHSSWNDKLAAWPARVAAWVAKRWRDPFPLEHDDWIMPKVLFMGIFINWCIFMPTDDTSDCKDQSSVYHCSGCCYCRGGGSRSS